MGLVSILFELLTWVIFLMLTWAVPWSVIGDDCLPGGNLFGIIILVDTCFLLGLLISKITIPKLPPLPSLFGMLIGGFLLANVPGIDVATSISPIWSSSLRALALTVILVKAGLDLDPGALNKMKGACIRLTMIPCFVETATCGVVCYLLLDFPWQWGFLLGFVLGAVTPAVIVPSLLKLQSQGYGVAKGVPSLVIAASSFDDVLAISGFSVIYSIVFSSVTPVDTDISITDSIINGTNSNNSTDDSSSGGSLAMTILRGPLEMIGGILISILLGMFLWKIPIPIQKGIIELRTMMVMSVGIFAIFASGRFNVPGAGALIAITTPFVASMRWPENKEAISENVGKLWIVFEPVMFGLIGAEIRLDKLDTATVGLGILALLICLVFRMIATFGAVSFAGFNVREKIFLCFSWMPKATVQAAIGGVALDRARQINAPQEIIDLASQVLTISVLSILITAPIGGMAIGLSGPKLLTQNHDHEIKKDEDYELRELKQSEEVESNDSKT